MFDLDSRLIQYIEGRYQGRDRLLCLQKLDPGHQMPSWRRGVQEILFMLGILDTKQCYNWQNFQLIMYVRILYSTEVILTDKLSHLARVFLEIHPNRAAACWKMQGDFLAQILIGVLCCIISPPPIHMHGGYIPSPHPPHNGCFHF